MIILFVVVPLLISAALLLRLVSILPCARFTARGVKGVTLDDKTAHSLMVLLGSGGHTGEMIRLLQKVELKKYKRVWVTSSGDLTSVTKAKDTEATISTGTAEFMELPRARKVGEPLASSFVSTIISFYKTAVLMACRVRAGQMPSLLVLNGPGTCVPLAYIIFGMHFLGMCRTRIVYVESLARVKKLSVSGLLILPIADRFIVQWGELQKAYGGRLEYYGILV